MKWLIAAFVALGIQTSFASMETIERLSPSLCEYVKADDRSSIRKKLKTANLEIRDVYIGFACQPDGNFNGGSLLKAASYYGATEVSSFLIKKLKKEDLQYVEHDGKKTFDWVKEAVAGGKVLDQNKSQTIVAEFESNI